MDRRPLGDRTFVALGESYFTRFQVIAWELSLRDENTYVPLDRNVAGRSAWRTDWRTINAGALGRISAGGMQLLAGGLYTHERIAPADSGVIITANGLQPPPTGGLTGQYVAQSGARAGEIAGLRALTFTTVEGLETVEGVHDVARGVQAATVIGRDCSWADSNDAGASADSGRRWDSAPLLLPMRPSCGPVTRRWA